jgi:hypothetical protein
LFAISIKEQDETFDYPIFSHLGNSSSDSPLAHIDLVCDIDIAHPRILAQYMDDLHVNVIDCKRFEQTLTRLLSPAPDSMILMIFHNHHYVLTV